MVLIAYQDGWRISLFLVLGLLIIVNAFVLHLFLKTDYTIENEELKIRSGFFKEKPIAISEIKAIRKTNSIISAPAASFDRIEVKYKVFNTIIISPKDKKDFIQHLKKINPNIDNQVVL